MLPIAVIDLETDPFQWGVKPEPFVSGYYDGSKFVTLWDEVWCIRKTVAMLDKERPHIIYAHNGGKFDFYYMLDYLGGSPRIINGRIVKATLGKHELRDSYAMLPFALEMYRKDNIDYNHLKAHCRTHYKDEIISYLKTDCIALYELVTAFITEFGNVLTVGSAAMQEIKQRHTFACADQDYDHEIRKQFYFGGRVQCFQTGIIPGPITVYDVNSMYPYVMRDYKHPTGNRYMITEHILPSTFFIVAEGKNNGAFCERTDTGITFAKNNGVFGTTIHEWNIAEHFGLFKPSRILKTYSWYESATFEAFVSHFYDARQKAHASGDKIHKLFYKYILNAGYGKFAQNPENFFDWRITGMEALPHPWIPAAIEHGKFILWKKPIRDLRYYNVATGASITGAARSVLLTALHHAKGLAYCDTDSIIATNLPQTNINSTQLGAWKNEGTFSSAAIAGKKLYGLYDSQNHCLKMAAKGVNLTGSQLRRIAQGATIHTKRDSPTYHLDGSVSYLQRKVTKTT